MSLVFPDPAVSIPENASKDRALIAEFGRYISECQERLETLSKIDRSTARGDAYHAEFKQFGELPALNAAINQYIEALRLSPRSEVLTPGVLCQLGFLHHCRYIQVQDFSDLQAAIMYVRQGVLLCPDGHPNVPKFFYLYLLSALLGAQFTQSKEPVDLNSAIELCAGALQFTPKDHPYKRKILEHISLLHWLRFQRYNEFEDINCSIVSSREALQLTPDGGLDRPVNLVNLVRLLCARYERLGRPASFDLEEAIALQTEALQLTSVGDPAKPDRLRMLSAMLYATYIESGELTKLDLAIGVYTEVVRLLPSDDIKMPDCLRELGDAHLIRYSRTGECTHLNMAVELHAQTVSMAPLGHPRRSACLTSLGSSLRLRYRRFGQLVDLDAAVGFHTEAVDSLPDANLSMMAFCLQSLASALHNRYERLGDFSDLNRSIERCQTAVRLTPQEDITRFSRLRDLGLLYRTRFLRLGNFVDIDVAIGCLTEAVHLAPAGFRAEMLNHLGSLCRHRFIRLDRLLDIHHAIEHHMESLLLTPTDDSSRPGRLSNLHTAFMFRYRRLFKEADLEAARECQYEAIALVPDGHPDKCIMMYDLGALHMTLYERTQDLSHYAESVNWYSLAANSTGGQPNVQMRAARVWAEATQNPALFPACIKAFDRALELIPQVAWLGSTVHHRFEHMATLSTVPIEAAAAAVSLNRYDLALQWLEQGRSVVWTQMLHLRTPLDELRLINAKLTYNLEDVTRRLEATRAQGWSPGEGLATRVSLEQAAREYRALAFEWENLIHEVRKLPGFDRFLLPKDLAVLIQSTRTGAVVMINVDKKRCDALALRPGHSGILHIPLPNLTHTQCADMRSLMVGALQSADNRACNNRRPIYKSSVVDDTFETILASLWVDVVRPILGALGYLDRSGCVEPPRVTWCTTGPLAFLPLHAAGIYGHSGERIYDYVVSSYTPTLSVLVNNRPEPAKFSGILAVGQAAQPGLEPLPGTTIELDKVVRKADGLDVIRLTEEDATPSAVLSALKTTSWVHLACHASQHVSDPTASAFHLHGGQLSLTAIIREPLPNADLAFLSACETAAGAETVPDEAMHLAAGMLMSGYRTVVATMWSIKDMDAPVIAEHFYSQVLEGGVPNSGKAARGLHEAVRHLRESVGEKEFARWVPYVHIGQ
ncbi:hypothetical protein FRC07_013820 [Ceratobasidium sp. 392]|nr:hypothetical protein FRC07_013820 [Ceratobasidium sp. 392]